MRATIQRLPPSLQAVFHFVLAFVIFLVGYRIFGERPSPLVLFGVPLVLAVLAYVQLKRRPRR